MRRSLLIFLFCAFTISVFAQKRDYLKNFTEGNYLFLEKNYLMAVQSFELAFKVDSINSNINYKMGLCYLNIPAKKKKALPFMERAVSNISKGYDEDEPTVKSAPVEAIYYYGKALHYAGKFPEAIVQFEKYQKIIGSRNKEKTVEVHRLIEMCNNAITMSAKPEHITITNLGDSINTEYSDYGPVINADESLLLFTSRRPGSTGGERGIDGNYYDDVYSSKRRPDGSWSTSAKLFSLINTNSNEATIGMSADGQKAYFYKDEDLYYSTLSGETWSALVPFGSDINSKNFETHICFSTDESVLYFVSDRPGGLGGKDIYRCVKLPNGSYSKPYNLGPNVNSKYDEDAPYLHPDGKKLFFSSEGHSSIGGLDIFYSLVSLDSNENIACSPPISLRMPINTPDDDEFYVPTTDGIHAYFSSAREGGFGDQDIYIADLPSEIKSDPLVLLSGHVTFDGSHDRPEKTEIRVFDAITSELISIAKPNTVTGKYLIIVDPGPLGKKLLLKFEATGFQPTTITVDVLPGSAFSVVNNEVELEFMNMESRSGNTISMGGLITNEDMESILDVKIVVKDNNTGELLNTYTTSSDVGFYYIVLEKGRNYNISFEAPGYLFQSQNVDIPKKPEHVEIPKSVKLERIQKGAKMTLNNIFFDKNKAVLRKQSMVEIDAVYKLMKEKPELVMEISGHTDNQGNDATNKKLSLDRAKAVVTFLTKKGIPAKRLVAKGYGKSQPVAENNLPDGKPDLKGQQLNRRVEMKILEDSVK
jgi:outer membrane protein OmpA-like peptidoglycan-associated protein/tetratricopeptide (TPR) repeat protein